MKITPGKAVFAVMLLLSTGFVFTLLVAADSQQQVMFVYL